MHLLIYNYIYFSRCQIYNSWQTEGSLGCFFLPKFGYFGHNFLTRSARWSIKGSKSSYYRLVFTTNLSQKLGFWCPGPGDLSQKCINLIPLWRHPLKIQNPKHSILNISTRRLSAYLEGLDSFLAQLAGELWWCKVKQEKWLKYRAEELL